LDKLSTSYLGLNIKERQLGDMYIILKFEATIVSNLNQKGFWAFFRSIKYLGLKFGPHFIIIIILLLHLQAFCLHFVLTL
jgi:hypothetical protein